MDRFVYVDKFKTTISGATINPGDTVITVLDASRLASISSALVSGDKLPITLEDPGNQLTYEDCYCTAVSGNQLTLERAKDGTTARTWVVGTTVANRVTSGTFNSIPVIPYDTRGRLRGFSPVETSVAIVDGLGLFTWTADTSQPEDDETCFATTSPVGRWLLRAIHWDIAFAIINDEFEVLDTTFRARFLTGSGNFAVTSVSAASVYTFTATVPGALVGSPVVATPPSAMNFRLAYSAWVSSANIVTIQVANNDSTTVSTGTTGGVPQGTWPVLVVNP